MADESERQSDVEETVENEQDYIRVAANEDGDPMEFPKEDDNTVTFSTVQAQFPKATGLKYRSPSGAWRAIRDVDNVLAAPKEGWGNTLYIISVPDDAEAEKKSEPRKRKAESATETKEESGESKPKQVKNSEEDKLTKDLPVTNLPYSCTEKQLREYFETNYGELAYCQIKTEQGSKKSRGFGFIRFKDADTAREAVNNPHRINGRSFYVKIKTDKPMKLFVGRLPNDVEKDEVEEYFSDFGELDDIYLPKPFRNFGFVTFSRKEDAIKALRADHDFKGKQLNVEEGKPDQREGGPRGGDRGGDRGERGGQRGGDRGGDRRNQGRGSEGRGDRGGHGNGNYGSSSYSSSSYGSSSYGSSSSSRRTDNPVGGGGGGGYNNSYQSSQPQNNTYGGGNQLGGGAAGGGGAGNQLGQLGGLLGGQLGGQLGNQLLSTLLGSYLGGAGGGGGGNY